MYFFQMALKNDDIELFENPSFIRYPVSKKGMKDSKIKIKIPSQRKTVQSLQKTDMMNRNNESNPNKRKNDPARKSCEARGATSDELILDTFLNPKIGLKISVPISFKIIYEDEMYFLENDLFEIFSFDKSLKKAREEIELQLLTLWNDYVMEDEASLSESSLLYKKLLLKYLEAKDD